MRATNALVISMVAVMARAVSKPMITATIGFCFHPTIETPNSTSNCVVRMGQLLGKQASWTMAVTAAAASIPKTIPRIRLMPGLSPQLWDQLGGSL
jgi:hypothetical protein